ncbi:MAG: glycoside hydrolase domain-containing protein [Bacteroidales bacterium]
MKKQTFPGISFPVLILGILITSVTFTERTFAEVRIWATGCTEKIQRDKRSELPHDRVWNEQTNTVSVAGVRGEHVPFQLIVTADQVNVSGITLDKTALQSGENILSLDNVLLYFEHHIKVYTPSGIHGEEGYWPDAIVPLTHPFNIHSGERGSPLELRQQPIWVDILVPADQPPGIYEGTIGVSSDEGKLGKVNIKLTIWDVTMPTERHYPAIVWIGSGDIARAHGLDEESPEFLELYYKYLELILSNRIDPGHIMSLGLEGRIEDGNYVLEWTNNRMEKFLIDNGLLIIQLSAAPRGIPRESGEQPFSETYIQHTRQYIEQVISYAKNRGWYDRLAFLCPVDEPRTPDEYEAVRRWAKIVKEIDPNIRFSITEQPLPQNPAWGSFVGYANSWIVHGNYLARDEHVQAITERQQEGEEVIWYISCDQEYPQPNYFIDREAADLRMVPWITWRYDLGGILYWASTFWREVKDPWLDPVTWKRSECNAPLSGEGTLIYPGNLVERYTGQENVFGPVSSVRFELLREGLEELELMLMLKESGGESEVDEIVESVCMGIRDFSRNPNAIDEAREKIIKEILKRK